MREKYFSFNLLCKHTFQLRYRNFIIANPNLIKMSWLLIVNCRFHKYRIWLNSHLYDPKYLRLKVVIGIYGILCTHRLYHCWGGYKKEE